MKKTVADVIVPLLLSFAVIAIFFFIYCMIAGCDAKTDEANEPQQHERFIFQDDLNLDYSIVMDRVTGVYYLLVWSKNGNIALTPLLNVDGLPMCVDDANHGDVESALADIRANQQRYQRGEL